LCLKFKKKLNGTTQTYTDNGRLIGSLTVTGLSDGAIFNDLEPDCKDTKCTSVKCNY